MEIGLQEGNILPQIDEFPIGKDILMAFEVAKVAVDVVKEIGSALIAFAQELGLVPDIDVIELGDRAIQAIDKGIVPEDYASLEEWVEIIQGDDWGYDPKISAEVSDEKKLYMGVGIIAGYLGEKYEQLSVKDFILVMPKIIDVLSGDRMACLAKLLQTDEATFKNVVQFFLGNCKSHEAIDGAVDALMAIEKTINPELSDNDAYGRVIQYQLK